MEQSNAGYYLFIGEKVGPGVPVPVAGPVVLCGRVTPFQKKVIKVRKLPTGTVLYDCFTTATTY